MLINCVNSGMVVKRISISVVLLLLLLSMPTLAQEAEEIEDAAPVSPQPSWSEGELIELDAVQIEGEIAQPNVTITVSRQEPIFREIALERTPPEALTDIDLTAQEDKILKAAKIVNWSEMLERPRY